MHKNQDKGSANKGKGKTKEVAGKVTDIENTERKSKSDNNGGKNGTVLAKISCDAKNETK
ncbi:CsbD family protein [Ectothiorhodospira shaposhnikovii]|uniref:CsbD family protein n=1 Tax=Ectothiorhodospira shaposhnikovii TaxID=1054 RepID=UPI00190533FF|nr:CsbD family protein [Ectothiorhodospira shaposhnikovii]MBK1672456.1 hypothetical protein [Ectothiorhodospira shaposhnikovii]